MLSDVAPFTYGVYRRLLLELQRREYRFESFPCGLKCERLDEPFVLLRHDIDFDLGKALAMAQIEAEMDVHATYFFLVRSMHYNLLSREGTALVNRILELGQHFGLHFDCAAYPEGFGREALAEACSRECRLLEEWFGRDVESVSYHRPNSLVLSADPLLSAPRPHTYMARFTRDIFYCSDSRGYWRFGDPLQSKAMEVQAPIHILIHPIWWNDEAIDPCDALSSFVARICESIDRSVAANCIVYRDKA